MYTQGNESTDKAHNKLQVNGSAIQRVEIPFWSNHHAVAYDHWELGDSWIDDHKGHTHEEAPNYNELTKIYQSMTCHQKNNESTTTQWNKQLTLSNFGKSNGIPFILPSSLDSFHFLRYEQWHITDLVTMK